MSQHQCWMLSVRLQVETAVIYAGRSCPERKLVLSMQHCLAVSGRRCIIAFLMSNFCVARSRVLQVLEGPMYIILRESIVHWGACKAHG